MKELRTPVREGEAARSIIVTIMDRLAEVSQGNEAIRDAYVRLTPEGVAAIDASLHANELLPPDVITRTATVEVFDHRRGWTDDFVTTSLWAKLDFPELAERRSAGLPEGPMLILDLGSRSGETSLPPFGMGSSIVIDIHRDNYDPALRAAVERRINGITEKLEEHRYGNENPVIVVFEAVRNEIERGNFVPVEGRRHRIVELDPDDSLLGL